MRLTEIHPGDTVRVDDGLPYHAVVVTKERGRLGVRPLCRQLAPRPSRQRGSSITGATRGALRRGSICEHADAREGHGWPASRVCSPRRAQECVHGKHE
jgi:hypothetical protein